jgi:hypothetical protein
MSFALLKLIALVIPLRATTADEAEGLDVTMHGEEAYLHTGVVEPMPAMSMGTHTAAIQKPVQVQ